VVLLDNTDNEDAGVYGEAHTYDGEKWVSTEESDALAMTYKDALELAELSQKTIHASEIYADLIVTKRLRVQSGNFLTKINETDGVDVTYGANKLFKVEPLTGKIYFGEHFWYNPTDGAIHTPNDKTVINADGTIYGEQSNFEESVVNGIKLYPVFGQSSVLPATLTLKENIPYDAEVMINVSVRLDVSGLSDFYVFPGSGKLSSANLRESIPITQFWKLIPRSMDFNRYAGTVFLDDTGTDYTLKYRFNPYDTPHIDVVYDFADNPMTRASLNIYDVMISGFIGILPN
jgi:hypothetical protein